jgi:DNA-binding NarL/FixJ family response regulator
VEWSAASASCEPAVLPPPGRTNQPPHLTCQEQAVTTLVAAGYNNREVATGPVLSVKTVECQLA